MNMLPDNSEMLEDKEMLATKSKLMERMRWNSLFASIGDTCKFVAGPLFGVAIGTMAASGFAITAAAGAMMVAAAALLVVGVASSYLSSRIWQSSQFDNFEINAKSTADHLVEKIKENNLCLVEHEENKRKDGKSWVQAVHKPEQGGVEVTR